MPSAGSVIVSAVPSLLSSYGIERLVAEGENDRDIAGGCPVTGFQLDALEAFDRHFQAEVERRLTNHLLYGEATP